MGSTVRRQHSITGLRTVLAYSFGVVEDKLWETEFFLRHLDKSTPHSIESSSYFSAFVTSGRSVTFALQFCMKGVDGFKAWYQTAQETLKTDPLASYFVTVRNDVQKKGTSPLNRVTTEHLREHMARQLQGNRGHVLVLPSKLSGDAELVDAVDACSAYFLSLLELVYDAYETFKVIVDPRWYYTHEHFESQGKTVQDAFDELGYPSGWGDFAVGRDEDAWRFIRSRQPFCLLNPLFHDYLDKTLSDPDSSP